VARRNLHLTADWIGDGHDLDPHRLMIALHEVGHLIVWQALPGVRITDVALTGKGSLWSVKGHVSVDWTGAADTEEVGHGYLVGLLAGHAADRIRCEHTGDQIDTSGCADDFHHYRRARWNHKPSRQWSRATILADARRALLANLPRLHRDALRLARTGRL